MGSSFRKRESLLTASVHDSKHDGRDPGYLTAGGIEDRLYFLKEHGDGLWEGVRESNRNEGASDHGPTPAPFRRGVAHGTSDSRCHGS